MIGFCEYQKCRRMATSEVLCSGLPSVHLCRTHAVSFRFWLHSKTKDAALRRNETHHPKRRANGTFINCAPPVEQKKRVY